MRASLVLALVLATTALAAKPKVVIDAPGPMKALLTKTLKKKFTPVPPKSDIPDEPNANAVKQAVREAGAVALVIGRLEGGVWQVMALNGADGAPLEQFKFRAPPGKKPLKVLPKGTDKRLEAALAGAKAPGKEPKKDEPKEEPKAEPGKEEPAAGRELPPESPSKKKKKGEPAPVVKVVPKEEPKPEPKVEEPVKTVEEAPAVADASERPMALNLAAGFRMFSRRLYYNQDLFKALSKYTLPIGPAIAVEADWFPGAHLTSGIAAHIGVSFGLNYAVGISSVATDNTRYGTTAMRMRVGLVGRIPLGPLELQPQVRYALQTYSIANGASGTAKPNVPNVNYSILRAGLGTKVRLFGPLAVTAGFAYQVPLSTGEISAPNYFPRLKVGGLDANFGIAVGPILGHVELRLGADYIRYWYTMNPEPGDISVAGGAVDDGFGGTLMLAFTL